MEEILKKSEELGKLIQDSDVFIKFTELDERVNGDSQALALLEKYNDIARVILEKQKSGDIIESYEKEDFRAMTRSVNDHALLREYLNSRDAYIDLLMKIHDSLGNFSL